MSDKDCQTTEVCDGGQCAGQLMKPDLNQIFLQMFWLTLIFSVPFRVDFIADPVAEAKIFHQK